VILALLAAVTFYGEVQPILDKHCLNCHRAGEIGRMPLETYEQARPWAKAILQAVVLKKMPPWFAVAGGPFRHEGRLSETEIATIRRWVEAGAERGQPGARVSKEKRIVGWAIPQPDLVVAAPVGFQVPAQGEVEYQTIILPVGIQGARWVQAAEIRPSARDVVHHIVAYVREPGDAWLQDKPRGLYFPTEHETKADILAVYTPGQSPFQAPAGMAKLLPAGAEIVVEVHYTPNGIARRDRVRIGLAFAKSAPELRVLSLQMNHVSFRIPPHEPKHRVSVSGTLPREALLLSMFPHMHLRGRAFEYAVAGGQGRYEVLLRVEPYDFYWQLRYELARPRLLPAGTRLLFTAWYDNSANNPWNPDPSAEVTYGRQSREEMMVGFFDVAVPADQDKRQFFMR
jgi:hypothetical protein